jgi:hypothetical protein
MPIVFIHGVSVRKEHDYYAPSEKTRESLIRSILLPGLAPANAKIFNPYWGGSAAQLAWQGKSLPTTRTEQLGSADVLIQRVAEEALIEIGPNVPNEHILPTLARKKGLGRAIDVLWPAASLRQNEADAGAFAEVAAGAAKLAEANEHPAWLDDVTNNVDFTERLLREVEVDSPPPSGDMETLGARDWWNAAVEGATHLAISAAAAASNPAVRAVRPALNEKITYFVGDVFCYLRSREKNQENCPIVKEVGKAIRDAAALRTPTDPSKPPTDPLIIIGHSMGGNIAYDLLTSFLKDVRCDLFLTVGSQVGLFEELKLFKCSVESSKNPNLVMRPANVNRWVNVFDLADVFSYCGKPIFKDIEDYEFSSGETVLTAHGAYLLQPRFYKRLKARI